MTKALIFDFDGTLVNSEQGIYQCFQSITKKLAPNRIEYANSILIGPPLRNTASEILGHEHQDSLDEFVQLFITMHDEHVIKHTQPYPDVIKVLKQLHTQNISIAVATNKRLAPTQKLIDHFGWNDYFEIIECADSKKPIRDKKTIVKEILEKFHIFKDSIFIGDTTNDAKAANDCGLRFIRANYGYGKKENWRNIKIYKTINNFEELMTIL